MVNNDLDQASETSRQNRRVRTVWKSLIAGFVITVLILLCSLLGVFLFGPALP
jgi:hypothetical protein